MSGYTTGQDILGGIDSDTKKKVINVSSILVGSLLGCGAVGAALYKKERGLGFALGALFVGPLVAYVVEDSYLSGKSA